MELPTYFKKVQAKELEESAWPTRAVNPFNKAIYEVVVDDHGRPKGDTLDYFAKRMTSRIDVMQPGREITCSRSTCSSELL